MFKVVLCQVRDIGNISFDNHNAGASLLVSKATIRKGWMGIKIQTIKTEIFEKMRAKLEQQGITMLGAPMKDM